jgi:hypothetical protein
MVCDNSPKERQRRQLERKLNQRTSYDRILIVSEGSKTEPMRRQPLLYGRHAVALQAAAGRVRRGNQTCPPTPLNFSTKAATF